MKYFIFFILTLIFSTSYACENANEIDVTKQCSFKYEFGSSDQLYNLVTFGLTKNQIITAAGEENGTKVVAVSAEIKFSSNLTTKLSGNIIGSITNGQLLPVNFSLNQKIDDKKRDAQGEYPEIINCTIYF